MKGFYIYTDACTQNNITFISRYQNFIVGRITVEGIAVQ